MDILDELDAVEKKMKKVEKEIKEELGRGNEKGAWEKQVELNSLYENWRKLFSSFHRELRNHPDFYKPDS